MRVLATIFFVLALLLNIRVEAATFSGDDASCRVIGRITYEVGKLRESGVTWKVVGAEIEEKIQDALTNPNSFVKNDADATWIRRHIKAAYDSKENSSVVALDIYSFCMLEKGI